MFDKRTLDHLRTLPDGSLTKPEVNLLIDYIERLERKLLSGQLATDVMSEIETPSNAPLGPSTARKCPTSTASPRGRWARRCGSPGS